MRIQNKVTFFLIINCVFLPFCFGGKCENLEVPTIHYDEIGCKPIFTDSTDCKPIFYNCSEVINNLNNGLCVFGGKSYKDGENVDKKSLRNCILGCFCSKDRYTQRPTFSCAVADCFPIPLGEGCHHKAEFGNCCPREAICPPFTEDQKCIFDGKTYFEGQSFVPASEKCQKCICKKGFAGKLELPFCERNSCNTGLFESEKIADFCAVVNNKEDMCCPYNWECQPKDFQNLGEKYTGDLGKDQCRFGDRLLKIGTKFSMKSQDWHKRDLDCACEIPPFVNCYFSKK